MYACFVDFAKAFDTVLHSALFCKLNDIGINGQFFNVLKDMYTTNYIHVRVGNTLTDIFTAKRGVRQGDNLSPNLFKIYLNDLPSQFSVHDDPVELESVKINCLLYADVYRPVKQVYKIV